MKKLTLDQLEIEYIATKHGEKEFAQMKGGTTAPCAHIATATAAIAGTNWRISQPSTPVCESLIPPHAPMAQ